MAFQNISLLIGLVAIGIPIALHLIARKEPRRVTFPSVRLLQNRYETNRSKLRVRRWWLLALRIAAIALVAFAFARPAIAQAVSMTWTTIGIVSLLGVALLAMASAVAARPEQRTLMWSLLSAALASLLVAIVWGGYTFAKGTKPEIERTAPVALAIVVDNAALSGWTHNDVSGLDRIKQAASQLVSAAGTQSRVAIIDRSATPAAFAIDSSGALAKVESLESLEVAQPIRSRIEAAARLLQSSEIKSRQVVLLSSMPDSSFSSLQESESIAALLREAGIRVTVWDLGTLQGINRSLSLAVISDPSPAPQSPVTVTSTLSIQSLSAEDANGDPDPRDSQSVTAECVLFPSSPSLPVVRDGEIVRPVASPVDRVNVEVGPGRDVEVAMTLPPLDVGIHHGAIRLIGDDALTVDDTTYFTVAVMPPSRLLIVGNSSEESEEIAWVVSAPAPIDDPASQYAIERIGFEDLPAVRFSDFAGVTLLNPPSVALSNAQLEQFRRSGGSVLVAAGDALGEDRVAIETWPTFQRRWRVPRPGTFLEIASPSHPTMRSLSMMPGGVPFQDFRIDQYWQLAGSDIGTVLMTYAGTGHAALTEYSVNRRDDESGNDEASDESTQAGTTLVLTTPIPELSSPRSAWNELFSADEPWPAFVMVREATRYLCGRNADQWTSPVGSPVTIPIDQIGESLRVQWFPPVGSTPIPIDVTRDQSAVVIERTRHSGVHWIRGAQSGLGFTTNLSRDGLSTGRVDSEKLTTLIGADQLRTIREIDEMEWTAADGSQVVSLWSPMMLLALIAFLLEQILGNRFYRRPSGRPGQLTSRGATA